LQLIAGEELVVGLREARALAEATLGCDAGPLIRVESSSHGVFVGEDVVVKIINADGHSRLKREIALAPMLPGGDLRALAGER
jgi:hypothetical protein